MEKIARIEMDTSKSIFQLHGVDAAGNPVLLTWVIMSRGEVYCPAAA